MVRLDRIITRSGDGGTTALSDGARLPKHHPLIAAIGAVDEVNSLIGLVRTEAVPSAIAVELPRIQNDCFDLGCDLATPPGGPYEAKIARITTAQVARLEAIAERDNAGLTPLTSFILPGGSRAAAWLHLARTVVRRAERDLSGAIASLPERAFNPECLRYLNRLSDVCFIWSRVANDGGTADVLWVPGGGG